MGALDKFLSENNASFDIDKILSPEVEEVDAAIPPSSLYKYYPISRSGFFDDPTIRFTQKTSLNDPFELTKRWSEFAGAAARAVFADYIRSQMEEILSNKGLVLALIKEEYARNGIFLNPDQIAEASHKLLSPEGYQFYNKVTSNALDQTNPFVDYAFNFIDKSIDEAFSKLTSEIGIFSLSETPVSEPMWGLYASSGAGFVIEFNAEHSLFTNVYGKSLFRKVKYTHKRPSDFFSNPLFLFQVKGEKWSFEQEWRMLKKLSECDSVKFNGDEPIHICSLKPGIMHSVIFGYNYDEKKLAAHGAKLQAFDPNIRIKLANVNPSRGQIELRELC